MGQEWWWMWACKAAAAAQGQRWGGGALGEWDLGERGADRK